MTTTPNRPTIAQRANRFAVAAALVFGMAVGCNYSPDDAPTVQVDDASSTTVTGTYEVPGGFLTVYADESARYTPNAGEAGSLVGCDREAGPCAEGQITGVDLDGRLMIAQDLNDDGVIAGDVEMGS